MCCEFSLIGHFVRLLCVRTHHLQLHVSVAPVHPGPDCSRFDVETHTTAQGVSTQDTEKISNTLEYGLPQELTVCCSLVHAFVRKYMFILLYFVEETN